MGVEAVDTRELLAALAADPEDRSAYEVYADHLTQHGDPRGEWIAVQLAREDRPTDPALGMREDKLRVAHETAWIGGPAVLNAATREPTRTWRRGFVDVLEIDSEYESREAASTYRDMIALPAMQLVRELHLGVGRSYNGRGEVDTSILQALHDVPPPATLRTLVFDCFDHDVSWTHLGEVARANPAFAAITQLRIAAGKITLGSIHAPQLRSLELYTGGLRAQVLTDLRAAAWPVLERLTIYFGTPEYGGDCTIEDAQRILDAPNLSRVTSLALCNSTFGDELAERILTGPIVPQLRRLDLSKSTFGDAGAVRLLQHAGRLDHLESLDLSECYVSRPMVDALLERLPQADLNGQRIAGGYGRYVVVSE